MSEMTTKSDLMRMIDWPGVLAQPRYAGGHEDVMRAIFGSAAKVAAEWIEGGYDGEEAFAYEFADGSVAVVTDYFGSCPGCDGWDDCSDEEARDQVRAIVANARVFESRDAAVAFLLTVDDDAAHYPFRAAANLLGQLQGEAPRG